MIFYILLNQITTLFLSINLLTTLTFDSEIQSYLYGGVSEEIFFQVTNKNLTLAIKPKTEGKLSNLLVITKNGKYYFDLAYDKLKPHQFIEIKDGQMTYSLTKKISTTDYEILEGDRSLLFVNKKLSEVEVNKIKIKNREYLSKGVPIVYEGRRILN